jgi:hypothetical protein
MQNILELHDSDKIKGHIYKIINTENDKVYIGQTRTHRKNKGKYRFFGYIGRFKDHISEAINNTKKNQCTYLNNAIRKNHENFKVHLLEICDIKDLDEREIYYIKHFNSIYPNGYNLTKGGKDVSKLKIEKESLNSGKKSRLGRKHTQETKDKIKTSLLNSFSLKPKKSENELKRISNTIKQYYDDLKIKKLLMFNLNEKDEYYIREVKNSKGEVHDYKIYIDRNNIFKVKSKNETLENKFIRLKNIIAKSKEIKSKNC